MNYEEFKSACQICVAKIQYNYILTNTPKQTSIKLERSWAAEVRAYPAVVGLMSGWGTCKNT